MKNNWSRILIGILLLIAQAAIDNFINLSIYVDVALFLFILIMIPYRASTVAVMATAFLLGLCVDFLGNTILGMTSAALVMAALARKGIISLTISPDILEKHSYPSLGSLGIRRFVSYAMPLVLIYNLGFILADCSGFTPFWHNLLRLAVSTALNMAILLFLFIICSDRRR